MIALGAVWGKVRGWAALVGLALFAVAVAFFKGRSEGKAVMEAEQQRKRDALQDEYNRIDAGPVDPGRAYDGLRKRSGGR